MPSQQLTANLIYLRKINNFPHSQMDRICFHKSKLWEPIEIGRVQIQLESLKCISDYFGICIDDLCRLDLNEFLKIPTANKILIYRYNIAQLSLRTK